MSNFSRFLNMNSYVYTTDQIPEGENNFYVSNSQKSALTTATASNLANSLVRRDGSGIINVGDLNCLTLSVADISRAYVRKNIGAVSNGSTFQLSTSSTERWSGEIYLVYSIAGGVAGVRKYNFYKAPGATGNGYFTQIYSNTNGGTPTSAIQFNNASGIFTFDLSGVGVSAIAYIDMMLST